MSSSNNNDDDGRTKKMSFNSMLIYGGALLALGAGIYIMYQEGFLDDILSKFNLSFYAPAPPASYHATPYQQSQGWWDY